MDSESTFKNISCYTGIVEKDMLYTFNNITGQLMGYELKNFAYGILAAFDTIQENRIRIIKIIKSGNILYLVPQNRKCIYVYNLKNRERKLFGNAEMVLEERQNICDAFMHGFRIVLFPAFIDEPILLFSTDTKKWDKYFSIRDLFKQKNIDLSENYYVAKSYQVKNSIWSAVAGTHFVFSVDLSNMDVCIYNVQCRKIDDFFFDEKEFWIAEQDSQCIFSWNFNYGLEKKYQVNPMGHKYAVEVYECVYSSDEMIIAVPNFENCISIIERNSGRCHTLDLEGKLHKVRRLPNYLWGAFFKYEDKLILLPLSVDKIVVISLLDRTVELHDGELRRKDYEKYHLRHMKEIMDSRKIMAEDKCYDLKDIIAYPYQQMRGMMNKENAENVGAAIWGKLC